MQDLIIENKIENVKSAGGLNKIYENLVVKLLSGMNNGCLNMYMSDGRKLIFGKNEDEINAEIRIKNQDFFRKCVLYGDVGFGEAYVDGDWDTGNITNVISWMLLNIENAPGVSGSGKKFAPLSFLKILNKIFHRMNSNTVSGSKKNISDHYDLNNDFFSLFLDDSMTYSSALYNETAKTLEEAQYLKYDRLCKKLNLKSSDNVLEIGCGWGGFATFAAKKYGCKITSVTISKEQFDYAKKKIEDENLSGNANVQLIDYRDITGKYDKIVSIEMLEAVGHKFLPKYFEKCSELLNKNGLLALQVITSPDSRYDSFRKGVDWIQKHIFPGSLLPSISAINSAVNKTSNLHLFDLKDFGTDYARTLATWRDNFNKNINSVFKLGFDKNFARKWNYYFSYCEAAFKMRNISVVQMVYTNPNNIDI